MCVSFNYCLLKNYNFTCTKRKKKSPNQRTTNLCVTDLPWGGLGRGTFTLDCGGGAQPGAQTQPVFQGPECFSTQLVDVWATRLIWWSWTQLICGGGVTILLGLRAPEVLWGGQDFLFKSQCTHVPCVGSTLPFTNQLALAMAGVPASGSGLHLRTRTTPTPCLLGLPLN